MAAPGSNPTGRFSGLADAYAVHRPSYPDEVVRTVILRAGLQRGATLVDVGCGTGIASRLFAERGLSVIGVEPNSAMRRRAEATPCPAGPPPRYRDGAAEATGLPDAMAECVVAAQAFHWFDAGTALREFHRILKPDGWVALTMVRAGRIGRIHGGRRRRDSDGARRRGDRSGPREIRRRVGGESTVRRVRQTQISPRIVARRGWAQRPGVHDFVRAKGRGGTGGMGAPRSNPCTRDSKSTAWFASATRQPCTWREGDNAGIGLQCSVFGQWLDPNTEHRRPTTYFRIDRARNGFRYSTDAIRTTCSASDIPGTAGRPCRRAAAGMGRPAVPAIADCCSANSYADSNSKGNRRSGAGACRRRGPSSVGPANRPQPKISPIKAGSQRRNMRILLVVRRSASGPRHPCL